MSTESQKSDSASESEENTLEEYPARPPTPRASPFREGFDVGPTLRYTVPMTRSQTRSPASPETEFSSDELVPPPYYRDSYREIDITELYQRYQDMYRANYPDVSLIKNNLNHITMIVPFI